MPTSLRQSLCFLLTSLLLLAGCGPTVSQNPLIEAPKSASALRPGDAILVTLRGIPDPSDNNVQLDDQGTITLPFIGTFTAQGKTPSELTSEVRQLYIGRAIYRNVDVSITVTERFVYVGGEVNRPGRVLWTPDLTLTKAIQAAGGFTLYALEGGIRLSRENRAYTLSATAAQQNPEQDPRLFPGDSINVPRTAF